MSGVRVRGLEPSLREAVLALTVSEAQLAYVSPVAKMLAQASENDGIEPYAIVSDEGVVGSFLLNFDRDATGHYVSSDAACGLEGFFVDRGHQGKGYGVEAVAALAEAVRARQPRIEEVCLTVNCLNKAAIATYLKGGFRDTGSLYHGGRSGPQHAFAMRLR